MLYVGCIMGLTYPIYKEVLKMSKPSGVINTPTSVTNGSYNIYVGERYVIAFAGDWSKDNGYEPLTMVLYNGDSYISRGYVPAGALPTNTDYWVKSSNFNGQLASLQGEVINNSQSINVLQNGLNKINKPYYMFIGDSYEDTRNPDIQGWATQTVTILGLPSSQYTIWADSSAGIVAKGSGTNMSYTDYINSAPQSTLNKVQKLIVEIDWNDYRVLNDPLLMFQNCGTFIDLCKSKMPNLEDIIFLPTVIRPSQIKAQRDFYNYMTRSSRWIIPPNFDQYYNNPTYFQSDLIHLTNDGYYQLALNLTHFLKGDGAITQKALATQAINANGFNGSIFTKVTPYGVYVNLAGTLTITANTSYIELFTIDNTKNINFTVINNNTLYGFAGNNAATLITVNQVLRLAFIETLKAGTYTVRIGGLMPAYT